MANRRLAAADIQPVNFAFTSENEVWANLQITKYPEGRQASAVIPLLWKAQEQAGGWLPQKAIEAVAQKLDMPYIRVLEVATFYTMFALEPVGRHFIQLCGTVPCHVKGALELKKLLETRIGPSGHVTPDGKLSWLEVECLGACCNAPMAQINYDYFEDLNVESLTIILDDLQNDKTVKPGPQTDRTSSEPQGAVSTLLEPSLFDGSQIGAWRKRFEQVAPQTGEAASQTLQAVSEPKLAKPDAGRAIERPVTETPAVRAAAGNAPAEPSRTTASEVPRMSPVQQDIPVPSSSRSYQADPSDIVSPINDEHRPDLLEQPQGNADDLKLIWGVGPKLEVMLNTLGIYHFKQIAAWNDMNLAWVDQHLGAFKGRAVRDNWIDQAKKLNTGWRPNSDVGEKH
jgi:NADH-quinone oxidoreductase subunit E